MIASCKSVFPVRRDRENGSPLEGVYRVEFFGNIYGAPMIQLSISQDSTFKYSIIGDCYRKVSYGKILCSETGMCFKSTIENPFLFATAMCIDSIQNNGNNIEIIMDSAFDFCLLNWFIVSDDGECERIANSRHYEFITAKIPVRFRVIGLLNEQHRNAPTEREIVCSQNIVINSYGVYKLTTDSIFAKYPLNYMPTEGTLKLDQYGNVFLDDLYLVRQNNSKL